MSAVAAVVKQRGFTVTGSDAENIYPPASIVLKQNRIEYFSGYDKKNVGDPDLVIISAGETPEKNPEVAEVLKKGINYASFAELIYNLFINHQRIIVSGTHGKTTTSSLIAYGLRAASKPINFIIGGYVQDFKTNFQLNNSDTVLFEGDEYYSSFSDKRPKFLHYHPDILILTNIDMDHFDYYKNINDLMDKFKKLIKTVPPEGIIIACHDNLNVKKLLKDVDRKIIWYGIKGNSLDWKAEKIIQKNGMSNYIVRKVGTAEKYDVNSSLAGDHNVLNVLASIAAMDYLKCDLSNPIKMLSEFKGPSRRFELKGVARGVTVIDDYAHHPTAVKVTLQAARSKYPNQKIWAVFEPHTFSRTKATVGELADAFVDADAVIIPDIYPAREKEGDFKINSRVLVDEISKNHQNVSYIPGRENVLSHLVSNCKAGDVVLIMAVGDFNKIALELIKKI